MPIRSCALPCTSEHRRLSDTVGRVTTYFDQLGREIDYTYYDDNALHTETWKDSSGATVNSVTYTYNTMGRKIRSENPAVQITDETGASYWVKPSEDYYYDLGGRLVGTRDANGTSRVRTRRACPGLGR